MQYHRNGFKPGNYQIPDEVREPYPRPPLAPLPAEVDVLIVGCGPAGLTMARQLAEFSDISTCIVDREPGPLLFGRADGISCRTMEIMEAFNSSEMIVKETYQLRKNAFWEPDPDNPDHIKRTHKISDARIGLSEFIHGIVNQARLHELLLDGMKHSVTGLEPHYSRKLLTLDIDQSLTHNLDAHPITATFERLDDDQPGKKETVKARYVVGTDGARSVVRKSLGIELKGDSANKAWGVMDVLVVTDYPDIRVKSFIQSKEHGAVMLIPREGGYLVRMYVELDILEEGQRAASVKLTEKDIIAKMQRIYHPFTVEVKEVAWWSIYEVGQRVAERFDDRPLDAPEDQTPRAAKQVSDGRQTNTTDIEEFMARQNGFIAGTGIGYYPSYLCTGHENQELASGFTIGQRFHSAIAVRVADGRPQHLGHLVKADGRWRIFIFGSGQNPCNSSSDSGNLIEFLANDPSSPVVRYTPKKADIDSVIDVYGVFQQQELSIQDIPDFLWPPGGKYGLRNYDKVFHAEVGNDVFDLRGINRDQGCMVVVRPDQHIATLLPLNAHTELAAFFDEFMIPPR